MLKLSQWNNLLAWLPPLFGKIFPLALMGGAEVFQPLWLGPAQFQQIFPQLALKKFNMPQFLF